MQRLIEAMGGRKAFMSLLTVLLGTVIEFVKPGGLSESYVMLLVGIVGIFSGANALVSWKGMSVGDDSAKAASEAPPAPGDGVSQVDELTLKTDYLANGLEGVRAEQQVQAEALDKATKLIKAALTIKQG
jgi:hypothetical protein